MGSQPPPLYLPLTCHDRVYRAFVHKVRSTATGVGQIEVAGGVVVDIYHPGLPAYRPRFGLLAMDSYKLSENSWTRHSLAWHLADASDLAHGTHMVPVEMGAVSVGPLSVRGGFWVAPERVSAFTTQDVTALTAVYPRSYS